MTEESWPTCPGNYDEILGCADDEVFRVKDDNGETTCGLDGTVVTPEICCACVDSSIMGDDV
jgi:hypothetical protein